MPERDQILRGELRVVGGDSAVAAWLHTVQHGGASLSSDETASRFSQNILDMVVVTN